MVLDGRQCNADFRDRILFNNKNTGTDVQDRETMVKNEILKQKSGFLEENNDHQEQVAVNHTDSISGTKKTLFFRKIR